MRVTEDLTWVQFLNIMDVLLSELWELHEKENFDFVVGISRGGTIPAVRISHHLKIPFGVVGVSGFNPERPEDTYRTCLGRMLPVPLSTESKILLVDDIIDHGHTLLAAQHFLCPAKIQTCCLMTKIPENELVKTFGSVIFGEKVDPNVFIIFPWEEEEE